MKGNIMSVRKGDRTEGKLQVLNKARELKLYSYNIIKSDKHIPKSARWLYAYPISDEVHNLCLCIRHANATYVTCDDDFKYRHNEQIKAHAHLEGLLDLIDDVYGAGYISGEQTEFWVGLVLRTDELLKAWIKSDKAKYNT